MAKPKTILRIIFELYSIYYCFIINISNYSGSKYEDNLEQVREGSLSTAILNRNNPKLPQTTASASVRNIFSSLN